MTRCDRPYQAPEEARVIEGDGRSLAGSVSGGQEFVFVQWHFEWIDERSGIGIDRLEDADEMFIVK